MTKTSAIEYPCDFPIKVIGLNSPGFVQDIKAIIQNHYPDINPENVRTNPSKNGNYLSISITVYALNQQSLDAFYTDLTKHPDVQMAL